MPDTFEVMDTNGDEYYFTLDDWVSLDHNDSVMDDAEYRETIMELMERD